MMSRWAFPCFCGAVLATSLTGFYLWHREEFRAAREAAAREEVSSLAYHVVIPRFEFREARFEDALAEVRRQAFAAGFPETIPIRVMSEEELEHALAKERPEEATAEARVAEPQPDPSITLTLSNIPLVEALRYLTSLCDRQFRITQSAIEITPVLAGRTIPPVLVRQEWRVQPGFFGSTNPTATAGSSGQTKIDAAPHLKSVGLSFPKGSSAHYDTKRRMLVMINTRENCDLMDTMGGCTGGEASWLDRIAYRIHSFFQPRPGPPPGVTGVSSEAAENSAPAISGL